MEITNLIKFGKKALKLFNEYIKEKSLTPQTRVYIRYFLTELEISETSCRSQGSSEIIQKPDWTITVFNFIEEKIKPMPEFKQLSQSIANRYKNNINKLAEGCDEVSQSAFWLKNFIQKLIYEKLEGKLSEDSIIEYASLFKLELELSPTEYKYVHYLDGIFLEPDSIKINDNILIRKTRKDDLEYITDIFFDKPRLQYISIPPSILEIEMSAKDEQDCYEYISRIFDSLRLYRIGSIYSYESIITKRTVIWPINQSKCWGEHNVFQFKKYTVKVSEADTFINFINVIEQKLNSNKEEKKFRSVRISLDRYNSALLEPMDIDRKLMTAIMGLESLFTLEKDRGENAFKLSIRVAKLLGNNLNFDDAEKIRILIEKAYNFRNKVVHGLYVSQEDRKEMNEILPDILNYLRISLIIFILNQEIGKDKIVEMIDKSMISGSRNEELNRLLKKNREEFRGVLA